MISPFSLYPPSIAKGTHNDRFGVIVWLRPRVFVGRGDTPSLRTPPGRYFFFFFFPPLGGFLYKRSQVCSRCASLSEFDLSIRKFVEILKDPIVRDFGLIPVRRIVSSDWRSSWPGLSLVLPLQASPSLFYQLL